MLSIIAAISLAANTRPLMLVHFMPWFVFNSREVGWHWRMNGAAEQVRRTGKIASHFQPSIGPYDSADEDVIRLQMALIKRSGFDGLLVDWYGPKRVLDYGEIDDRVVKIMKGAEREGLQFAVVYEDQSAKHARENGAQESLGQLAHDAGRTIADRWLSNKLWIKLGGRPIVLVFGPQAFGEAEFVQFRQGVGKVNLLTLHAQKPFADGVFDWPLPSQGTSFTNAFMRRTPSARLRIATAYPRFRDYYEEGGQAGFPEIQDKSGATYRETLRAALKSNADAVQVATWNDWQEGTQVEPSIEFGCRDLIETQKLRREVDPRFRYKPEDINSTLQHFLNNRRAKLPTRR